MELDCKDTRSHIYAHINFPPEGRGRRDYPGEVEYFEFEVYHESQIYTCVKFVREFLATKGITIGVLLYPDKFKSILLLSWCFTALRHF